MMPKSILFTEPSFSCILVCTFKWSTGENCSSRKENQWNRQQTRENKRGTVSRSCCWERVPGQRGKKWEEGSNTRAEEEREGGSEEEKRDGRFKVRHKMLTHINVFNI